LLFPRQAKAKHKVKVEDEQATTNNKQHGNH